MAQAPLAYHDMATITAVKSFIVQPPGACVYKTFFDHNKSPVVNKKERLSWSITPTLV